MSRLLALGAILLVCIGTLSTACTNDDPAALPAPPAGDETGTGEPRSLVDVDALDVCPLLDPTEISGLLGVPVQVGESAVADAAAPGNGARYAASSCVYRLGDPDRTDEGVQLRVVPNGGDGIFDRVTGATEPVTGLGAEARWQSHGRTLWILHDGALMTIQVVLRDSNEHRDTVRQLAALALPGLIAASGENP